MNREQRIMLAAFLQATPKAIEVMMLRQWAKEERGAADLYDQLIPGGRERAEASSRRLDALADSAAEEMVHEAERAARIATILEGWADR